MKPQSKKYLSYFVIGTFFFLGGVEYAVILPTAWLYLQMRFNAQYYVLGILISAFCLSSLVAGPLMGRWSDRLGRTKGIFIFANLFEIVGNVMYFIGINSWFLVAARFVAGFGAGVGAPIIADISRITTSEERTGVISLFMAVRQFGLIVGPGFNLFLRTLNFNIGSFVVDKYSAPGAFMALLWLILEVMVVIIYWDLPKLHSATIQQSMNYTYRQDSESQLVPTDPSPSMVPEGSPETGMSYPNGDMPDNIEKGPGPPMPVVAVVQPAPRYPNIDTAALTSSTEMIESAERFMGASSADSGPIMFSASPIEDPSPLREREQGALTEPVGSTPDPCRERITYGTMNGGTVVPAEVDDGRDYVQQQSQPEDSTAVVRSPTGEHKDIGPLSWKFYYDEFIREEIIAILAVVFMSFFNQTAMEGMITPLAVQLLDWDELQISILYCLAGIEILAVFVLIRFLSRHFQDRGLLLFGSMVVCITIAGLVWYLPQAPPHNPGRNLAFFIVGVVLDVFGLPFLVVTSTSLYSKITREETQGFSQGVRGVCGGIGTLLGPLWADSLLNNLYLMLGVMLGLMVLALGMLLLSYRRLKVDADFNSEVTRSVNADSEPCVTEDEAAPLLRSDRNQ